ncbi:MAG: cytidylate kinase family protein [bacterium]|nr:cytidylate kinase family protein [bacterium]
MTLKFDNLTISGGIAVGTSTLANNLKTYLKPYSWTFFSGGEFMRDYAIKKGLFPKDNRQHHNANVYSDEFDKQIDYGMRERLQKEKHIVLEAWLSGFFAKDLKNTLKVLLVCSNEALRIDRVANRDQVSISEAKNLIKERVESNFKKWERLYGVSDFFDPKYYDLILDTYSSGQMETAGKVLDALGYDNGKIVINKK